MPEPVSSQEKMRELQQQVNNLDAYEEELRTEIRGFLDSPKELEATKAELLSIRKESKLLQAEMVKLESAVEIENALEKFKVYLPVGKYAIDSFKGEVSEVIGELMSALLDVHNSLEPQLARFSKDKAQSQFRQFSDLQAVGFNKQQAFMLTMASIHPINWSEMARQSSQNVAAAKSKRS